MATTKVKDPIAVQTPRHKKKLEALRGKDGRITGTSGNNGLDQTAIGGIRATQGGVEGTYGIDASRNEGMENGAGIDGGSSQGIRPLDSAGVNAAARAGGSYDQVGTSELTSAAALDPLAEEERRKELHRQRQARYAARKKAQVEQAMSMDQGQSGQSSIDGFTDPGQAHILPFPDQQPRFTLKNPFKKETDQPPAPPVKLFTAKEMDEEKERLAFVYLHGSGLLDNVLEIVVKGHEKVTIWQFSEGEAAILAEMHLERARRDQNAARSARLLLALYDRIFLITLLGPRVVATGQHVIQRGVSFK